MRHDHRSRSGSRHHGSLVGQCTLYPKHNGARRWGGGVRKLHLRASGASFFEWVPTLPAGWHRIGQKVVTPSRFMKAPWPVSLFQQVSPFSSEAHT